MTVPLGYGVSDDWRPEAISADNAEGQVETQSVAPDSDGAPSVTYEEAAPGGN